MRALIPAAMLALALGCGGPEPAAPNDGPLPWEAASSAAASTTADAGPPALRSPSAKAVPSPRTFRYLALGDSFTIGTGSGEDRAFPAVFARSSACAVELRNVAVDGYTTDDVIARELPVLDAFRPDFVTLAIGANDLVRRRPIDGYRKNVRLILETVVAGGVAPGRLVLLPQPNWSRSPEGASFGVPAEIASRIAQMNDVLRNEGDRVGARWLPIEGLLREQSERRDFAEDGLHPSAAAYAAWASELDRAVCP